MQKLVLLGDEAIAQGAIDSGVTAVYAYPGTPSTEITEYIIASKEARERNVIGRWTANEKTAVEAAIGVSYAGKRAMACMKHVGLNVAADPFMNAAITGTNGGFIVVSADDPSMHSSQNEQDSRYYGKFALIPFLEPSSPQEAYDMVSYGFDLSEKYHVPVLLRITTRLAHSRAQVMRKDAKQQNSLRLPSDLRQFVLLPVIARKRYAGLLGMQPQFVEESEQSPFNVLYEGKDQSLGIIASGIAYNYVMELFPSGCPYPILKIGQYPLPVEKIKRLAIQVDKLIVVEEGYPLIEEWLQGLLGSPYTILGRFTGHIPRQGELNPVLVGKALGIEIQPSFSGTSILVNRPPSFCPGCPHIDSFNALNEAMKAYSPGRVFSDIGCYTMGALPPFNSINSCVDMGASITMAKGAADVGLVPAVAVIGDSTFTHSGMTGLLDAVIDNSPITVMILDNSTTGMTGGQPSHAYNRLKDICLGIGVHPDHIRIIRPLRKYHEENIKVIAEELAYPGVSVIIPTRECVKTLNRRMQEKFKNKKS